MSKTTIRDLMLHFPGEGSHLMLVASRSDGRIVGTVIGRELRTAVGTETSIGIDVGSKETTVTKVRVPRTVIKTVQFSKLYVDPSCRRNGVGRLLLTTLEKRAKEAASISCYVKPENIEAQKFYRKLGYQLSFIYDDGDMCFSKTLNKS